MLLRLHFILTPVPEPTGLRACMRGLGEAGNSEPMSTEAWKAMRYQDAFRRR